MKGRKTDPERAALALLDPDGSFIERLRQDRATLMALLKELADGGSAKQAPLERLQTLAHRLAGAAGTFGHGQIGEAAISLEDCLPDIAFFPVHSIDPVLGKASRLCALLDEALGRTDDSLK